MKLPKINPKNYDIKLTTPTIVIVSIYILMIGVPFILILLTKN